MNSQINKNNQVVIYKNGEIEIKVQLYSETIWLSANEIAMLFDVQRPAVVKHVNNIYKTDELDKKTTCSILEQVAKDGKKRKINLYNLDSIIAIGYRVNSKRATQFRIWATKVLKQYIENGYTINSKKITHERFKELENNVTTLKLQMKDITTLICNDNLNIKQGIFYNGEIFDAYIFINSLFKSAKKDIVLIDNYIDESILVLLSKYLNINFIILTKNISKQLKLDIAKYNAQYNNLTIRAVNKFHDRFLIIDSKEAYHIGASFKDLGSKIFAFSKIDINLLGGVNYDRNH